MQDRHHILFNRQEWSLRPDALSLRENPALIATMDRQVHNELHDHCPAVPLLGHHALLRTLNFFESSPDQLESMDNLMKSIEQASNHPKAHIIEKHLAELAVWSIDLQTPFVADARRSNVCIVDFASGRR